MPYVDAVSSGFVQMQLTSAFGTRLRMLSNIACSVHSLPRLPVPKVPKRAIFLRLPAVLIGALWGAERHDCPHAAQWHCLMRGLTICGGRQQALESLAKSLKRCSRNFILGERSIPATLSISFH